ncbi:neurofilament heavy polypeptide-like [Uranotaenia lowii]|uniref:neurofilament heavy polypeptide-like n=1 Tax=Uranotaenia lowii TaxID=190385 RepID=UPI00247A1A11|nr:neurofilament heavy polypeptide-like [Uranotaenia lowii]
MGLKLKWFRRRITFEGIPSAPERNNRRKEQNSGVTVIGVYRRSVNCEDYVEPSSRSSYFSPPPVDKPAITKSTATATSKLTKSNVEKQSKTVINDTTDKITYSSKNPDREAAIRTPPEPSYSPPKLPANRGLPKTKSTPNLQQESIDLTSPISRLETSSIEVLNEVVPSTARSPIVSPAPRTTGINYNAPLRNTQEFSSETSLEEKPTFSIEKLKDPNSDDLLRQQPEFFNEILQKVNGLASTSKVNSQIDEQPPKSSISSAETESFDDIFMRVQSKPREAISSMDETELNPPVNISRTSSIDDIFEPRPPEFSSDNPLIDLDSNSVEYEEPVRIDPAIPELSKIVQEQSIEPKPIKSILKKRAPMPPQQQPEQRQEQAIIKFEEIPTPPPRSIRKQEPVPVTKPKDTEEDNTDDDEDDDDTWNRVFKHRSSINHTLAAQVDPQILQNVPVSLKTAAPRKVSPQTNPRELLEDAPKTLRGMRNTQRTQRDGFLTLGASNRASHTSDFGGSEASA